MQAAAVAREEQKRGRGENVKRGNGEISAWERGSMGAGEKGKTPYVRGGCVRICEKQHIDVSGEN